MVMLVRLFDLKDDLNLRKESLGSLPLEIDPCLIDQPVSSSLKRLLGLVKIRRAPVNRLNPAPILSA
jgi:hypothetical protein